MRLYSPVESRLQGTARLTSPAEAVALDGAEAAKPISTFAAMVSCSHPTAKDGSRVRATNETITPARAEKKRQKTL